MVAKGETKTDISSADEAQFLKRKKPKLLLDSDIYSSCPVYPGEFNLL